MKSTPASRFPYQKFYINVGAKVYPKYEWSVPQAKILSNNNPKWEWCAPQAVIWVVILMKTWK